MLRLRDAVSARPLRVVHETAFCDGGSNVDVGSALDREGCQAEVGGNGDGP